MKYESYPASMLCHQISDNNYDVYLKYNAKENGVDCGVLEISLFDMTLDTPPEIIMQKIDSYKAIQELIFPEIKHNPLQMEEKYYCKCDEAYHDELINQNKRLEKENLKLQEELNSLKMKIKYMVNCDDEDDEEGEDY